MSKNIKKAKELMEKLLKNSNNIERTFIEANKNIGMYVLLDKKEDLYYLVIELNDTIVYAEVLGGNVIGASALYISKSRFRLLYNALLPFVYENETEWQRKAVLELFKYIDEENIPYRDVIGYFEEDYLKDLHDYYKEKFLDIVKEYYL